MSWRRLQHVFSVKIFVFQDVLKTSWRCPEDVLKTSRKTSWRRFGRRKIVMLKMSWRCLEDMSWRRLEDMSWKHLQDVLVTRKMGISASHKSKCVCIYQVYISQIYIWRIQGESKIIKVGLWPSKKVSFYFLQWKHFKNNKKYFLFHLKSSFCSQDF